MAPTVFMSITLPVWIMKGIISGIYAYVFVKNCMRNKGGERLKKQRVRVTHFGITHVSVRLQFIRVFLRQGISNVQNMVIIVWWWWKNQIFRIRGRTWRMRGEFPNISQIALLSHSHYNDDIMSSMASQIASLTVVYSTVYSDADQRTHQSSASLAFVRGIHRGPVNSPHKGPVTRKMFPFDDVIMRIFRNSAFSSEDQNLMPIKRCLIIIICQCVRWLKFVQLLLTYATRACVPVA